MATFSIYFENNYGSNQNYAVFAESPRVTSNTGDPDVFSNVFLAKNVANNSSWNISIAKTYYAYTGVSPSQLQPGVIVSSGSCKLVTLGTKQAPGTTWAMYNNAGSPAFENQNTYTASAGSYEIDTGTDFTPNLNFVIGLGGVDPYGRQIPIATFGAPRNAKINIQPVTKYYIASYNASVGSVINTKTVGNAAVIDFTANPGMYGAIVKQDSNGAYEVNYAPQAAFASFINARAVAPAPEPLLTQLLQYLGGMERRLDTDIADNNPLNSFASGQWSCTGTWVNATQNERNIINSEMEANMTNYVGYTFNNSGTGGTKLSQQYTCVPPKNAETVLAAWTRARNALVDPNKLVSLEVGSLPGLASDGEDGATGDGAGLATNGYGGKTESIEDMKARAMKILSANGLTDLKVL